MVIQFSSKHSLWDLALIKKNSFTFQNSLQSPTQISISCFIVLFWILLFKENFILRKKQGTNIALCVGIPDPGNVLPKE